MLELVKGNGRYRSAGWPTIRDVLGAAIDFERDGAEYYRTLARSMDQPAHELIRTLAADGLAHARTLESVQAEPAVGEQLDAPATVRRRIAALPQLPAAPLEDDILDYAEAREHFAFDMYDRITQHLAPGEFRDAIVALRDRKQQREQEARRCGTTLLLIF
jgi:hypothetical protein